MLQHLKSNITVAPALSMAANGKPVAKLLAATTINGERKYLNASLWEGAAEQLAAADIKPGDFAIVSLIDPKVETYTRRDGSAGESVTGQVRAIRVMRKGQKGVILALTVATARELARQPELPSADANEDNFPG